MKTNHIALLIIAAACSVGTIAAQDQKSPPKKDTKGSAEEELTKRLLAIQNEFVKGQVGEIRSKTEKAAQASGEAGLFKVSSELRTLPKIDKAVLADIERHRQVIRQTFAETARQIESGKAVKVSYQNDQFQVSAQQSAAAERLRDAIEQNTVSLNSLALAVTSYLNISEDLFRKAREEQDASRKFLLYVQYTALVYELSDIVIQVLSDFELAGIGEIRKLHDDRVASVGRIKTQIQKQRDIANQQTKAGQLSKEALQKEMKTFDEWNAALDTSMTKWTEILSIIDNQKKWQETAQKNISQLQNVRQKAQIQLDILQEVGIVKELLNYVQGLENIMRINDIPLLPLDSSVVNELIGIGSPEKVAKPRETL